MVPLFQITKELQSWKATVDKNREHFPSLLGTADSSMHFGTLGKANEGLDIAIACELWNDKGSDPVTYKPL